MDLFTWLRDTSSLTPHGFCLFWEPGLLWLDAVSDGLTMLAYFTIPLALLWFVRRRRDLPHRLLALLFVAFIIACGMTHGIAILTLWVPAYHVEAVAKLVTACLSVTTACVLWPLLPKLLAIPSAASMTALNAELQNTIAEQGATALELGESRQRLLLAQAALCRTNEDLERRVADRTAELVRLNEAASRNEARFRGVVEAAPNAMVMAATDGRIEMVNTQTERLFGYARSEMLGRPVEMLLPPPQARPVGAAAVRFGARKDGSRFEVEIGLNPLETEDGVKVLSAIVDISDRVRLEAQLRQSQKMEAIGRITAGVAHDFNNLLQNLGGSLELLQDGMADPDKPGEGATSDEWLEVALRSITRGRELTARLLSFSRRQVLTTRAVPVGKLLSDVKEMISHFFEASTKPRSELVVLAAAPDLAVLADAGQLEAALINLAVNARDAMASGGCLRIAARESDADRAIVGPGRYCVIAVSDTGAGMDEATLAQAFEPFFTTKGPQGSGLGLSMVQGFARQSNGEVLIISAPGKGTTVELWLPSASMPPAPSKPAEIPSKVHGHVLLVDDSADVLLTVSLFLKQAGLQVTAMQSGDQAVRQLVDGARFDAIVTDFAMPGLNGLELLAQARAIDPSVPALLITGFYDPDMAPGLDGVVVLRKPFNRMELTRTLCKLIRVPGRV